MGEVHKLDVIYNNSLRFNNLVYRELTEEDMENYDTIVQQLDNYIRNELIMRRSMSIFLFML